MQNPSNLAKHVGKMQYMPFDGVTIRTSYSYTFQFENISEKDVKDDIATLTRTQWGRFDNNFFYFVTGKNIDWFDEKAWGEDGHILRNIGFVAKVARAGGCAGLLFDPEFIYWGNSAGAFRYSAQPGAGEKSFDQMAAMVRSRGRQFMQRIQQEFPDPVILNLFWGTHGFLEAREEYDPENRNAILKKNAYGLLPAFMSGMLDAAGPNTVIVDGNEPSYYYNKSEQYITARRDILHANQALVPEPLQEKYRNHVQCGHAIFADYLCNTFPTHLTSTYMTPAERMKWVEHNVYWALKTSSRYVWFYNENMEWLDGRNIPAGLVGAIESARRKVATGEPLGFEISPITARAWREGVRPAETRRLNTKQADIPKLKAGAKPPVIDGHVDDTAWKAAANLGPFENYAVARLKELEGTTQARMTYDDTSLYVAFSCNEPAMLETAGTVFRDQHHDGGDRVEIAVAADVPVTHYYHIVIDIENNRWDSFTKAGDEIYGEDSSWRGSYQSATSLVDDQWYVELAIPWTTLKMDTPTAGLQIKGNLMRRSHRRPSGVKEFSTWSESRKARHIEAEHFGTWQFVQ